jgi:hypothetical protein
MKRHPLITPSSESMALAEASDDGEGGIARSTNVRFCILGPEWHRVWTSIRSVCHDRK